MSQERTHKLEDIEPAAFAVLNSNRGLFIYYSKYGLKPPSPAEEKGSVSGLNPVKSTDPPRNSTSLFLKCHNLQTKSWEKFKKSVKVEKSYNLKLKLSLPPHKSP